MSSQGASGGSHGGRGGRGANYRYAGQPYGSIFAESTWGSGGGSHVNSGTTGGRGGGYMHVYVTQSLTVTGSLRANGGSSTVSLL